MTITQRFNRQRRLMGAGLVLAVCGLLSSCASLSGPRKVELPLHKLQAGLERRFPLNNRLMQVFDIRLSRPMLSIQPELDRIALALDASVSPPFARDAWTGSLAFSGRLYVDPGRSAVMMAEPRVDRLVLGANPEAERQLTRVANTLIDTVVRDMPVYSFNMDELRYAGVQFVPTRIETTRTGLLVTLEPAK